jgi:cobalt-zinc-cadmium efflux system protein
MSNTHTENHTHAHAPLSTSASIGRLKGALIITLAFVFVEAGAGWLANSLALLTDAAHNLTDVIALALSWYAMRLVNRPANEAKTFGYHRAGILIALLNSTTLVLISLGIFYEAYHRFINPPEVDAPILIAAASVAFIVNAGTALMIHRGSEHDLNMRSTFIHLAGDAVSTFAAILAGVVIAFTGFQLLDPIVSVFIGILILWNAWGIIRESVDILLEGTPADLDVKAMVEDVLALEGVRGVHDVHVWSLTQDIRMLSAHILTDDLSISAGAAVQHSIDHLLEENYGIRHATLQLECADCDSAHLYCNMNHGVHTHNELHMPS